MRSALIFSQLDERRAEYVLSARFAITHDDWLFELKLDGYRLLAAKRGHDVLLLTRNGLDYTDVFPEIARAIKALPIDELIIDRHIDDRIIRSCVHTVYRS